MVVIRMTMPTMAETRSSLALLVTTAGWDFVPSASVTGVAVAVVAVLPVVVGAVLVAVVVLAVLVVLAAAAVAGVL